MIRFSPTGQIILASSNDSMSEVVGRILPINVWTHIVHTYSITNGLRLYINGTLNGITNSMAYSPSNEVNILTLGNALQGNIGNVSNVYYGLIDEFRVYTRELNITNIQALTNL